MVGAQIDDSKIKYKRVDFHIWYSSSESAKAFSFAGLTTNEKNKYSLKELPTTPTLNVIINSKGTDQQYRVDGQIIFNNDIDALAFKDIIFPQIKSSDVVYAILYYLDNTDHWSMDKRQPDMVLQKIEYGDASAVYSNP